MNYLNKCLGFLVSTLFLLLKKKAICTYQLQSLIIGNNGKKKGIMQIIAAFENDESGLVYL